MFRQCSLKPLLVNRFVPYLFFFGAPLPVQRPVACCVLPLLIRQRCIRKNTGLEKYDGLMVCAMSWKEGFPRSSLPCPAFTSPSVPCSWASIPSSMCLRIPVERAPVSTPDAQREARLHSARQRGSFRSIRRCFRRRSLQRVTAVNATSTPRAWIEGASLGSPLVLWRVR